MAERHIVAHVPVISRGYLDFFERHKDTSSGLHIVDNSLLDGIDGVRKDVRRLVPDTAASLLESHLRRTVRTIGTTSLRELVMSPSVNFVMPADEVSSLLAEDYSIEHDRIDRDPAFLRWDRGNITSEHDVDATEVDSSEIPVFVRESLSYEIRHSVDWWRQVGCVFFNDKQVLSASHNRYKPFQYSAETDGDIRSQSYRGTSIEIANAQHAEAAAVAQAAKDGVRLEGSQCVVNTFPCPVCAKLLADTGIDTLYFSSGYSVADGLNVLTARDIKIRRVALESTEPHTKQVPYPSAIS